MKLFFIRHGENQANIDHVMSYKIVDHPLTPRGVEQAQHVAGWLAARNVVRVYASPLRRALQTGEIVATSLGLGAVRVLEDLREIHVGVLDGRGDPDAWTLHDEVVGRWDRHELAAAFDDGEDLETLRTRLQRAVAHIIAESADLAPDQAVAIIAHGGILNHGLWPICKGVTVEQRNAGLKNTAVVEVEADAGEYDCAVWGSIAHLPEETQ